MTTRLMSFSYTTGMQTLRTIRQRDIDPQTVLTDTSAFRDRRAARAVLFDADGKVYLMHVSKHSYHKLPGGGIDRGESVEQALARELLEEVGCKAKVTAELGEIIEYRNYDQLRQVSYCYTARQVGEQVAAALEEGEIEEGLVEVKAENLAAAIALLRADKPDNLEGQFIQQRDLAFLEAAQAQV